MDVEAFDACAECSNGLHLAGSPASCLRGHHLYMCSCGCAQEARACKDLARVMRWSCGVFECCEQLPCWGRQAPGPTYSRRAASKASHPTCKVKEAGLLWTDRQNLCCRKPQHSLRPCLKSLRLHTARVFAGVCSQVIHKRLLFKVFLFP